MSFVLTESIWEMAPVDLRLAQQIADQNQISPFLARLLCARGIVSNDSVQAFFSQKDAELPDPFLLDDMDLAVRRIEDALAGQEKVMVYGDYDADGVTATALLYTYLKMRGAQVDYYIPKRFEEGYGLNCTAVDRIAGQGVSLIITVDCGVTGCQEVAYAAEKGIDVVVTDHHECPQTLPAAFAVVNPKRADSAFPFQELAGVGVAYFLVLALDRGRHPDRIRREYADLVAVGTIADVMPLLSVNRTLVKVGLALLAKSKNPGLRALLLEAGFEIGGRDFRMQSSTVSFGLAPRINAAGRMGDVRRAVELFTTKDGLLAEKIARELCACNRERQMVETKILTEALVMMQENREWERCSIIVLAKEGWHPGVTGIVASRITEKYHLPSILISMDGAFGRGSARSVPGFNINQAISSAKELLVKNGGHELAAGFTIGQENLAVFTERIREYARQNMMPELFSNRFPVDMELEEEDLTIDNAEQLTLFEPYGAKNPVPQFCLAHAEITGVYAIGDGKHTKLTVRKGEKSLCALCFKTETKQFPFLVGSRVELLCQMDVNSFRGVKSLQLIVKDIKRDSALYEAAKRDALLYRELQHGAVCPKEHVPQMQQFRAAFIALKAMERKSDQRPFSCDLIELQEHIRLHDHLPASYLMMRLIIDVFCEMRLIQAQPAQETILHIAILPTEHKVNLDDSKLLQRLRLGAKAGKAEIDRGIWV